jgi:hypothetical protein
MRAGCDLVFSSYGDSLPGINHQVDRVNFVLFWGMARLIQEMALEMRRRKPEFPPISEDMLVDCLSLAPTEQNARDNPVFELLLDCLDSAAAPEP